MQVKEPISIELLEPRVTPRQRKRQQNNIESKYEKKCFRVLRIGMIKKEEALLRYARKHLLNDRLVNWDHLSRDHFDVFLLLMNIYRKADNFKGAPLKRVALFFGMLMILLQSLDMAAKRITLDLLDTIRCIPPRLYRIYILNNEIQLNITK